MHGGAQKLPPPDPDNPKDAERIAKRSRNWQVRATRRWLRDLRDQRAEAGILPAAGECAAITRSFPDSAFRWPSLKEAAVLLAEAYVAGQIGASDILRTFMLFRMGEVPAWVEQEARTGGGMAVVRAA